MYQALFYNLDTENRAVNKTEEISSLKEFHSIGFLPLPALYQGNLSFMDPWNCYQNTVQHYIFMGEDL